MSPSNLSIDPLGFRCEAVLDDPRLPAQPAPHSPMADDPAVLIGLAMSFAQRSAAIPQLVRERLEAHARHGDAACRTVLGWIDRRQRRPQAEVIAASNGESRHG